MPMEADGGVGHPKCFEVYFIVKKPGEKKQKKENFLKKLITQQTFFPFQIRFGGPVELLFSPPPQILAQGMICIQSKGEDQIGR